MNKGLNHITVIKDHGFLKVAYAGDEIAVN